MLLHTASDTMVRAWYMDESDDDQRLPHMLQPNQEVNLEDLKKVCGLSYCKVSLDTCTIKFWRPWRLFTPTSGHLTYSHNNNISLNDDPNRRKLSIQYWGRWANIKPTVWFNGSCLLGLGIDLAFHVVSRHGPWSVEKERAARGPRRN